ncbi:hypothetical protein [Longispora urticae]
MVELMAFDGEDVPGGLAELVAACGSALDGHVALPDNVRVSVVFAGNFEATVEEAWRRAGIGYGGFGSQRLGGTVQGKSVAVTADQTAWWVIVNAGWWAQAGARPSSPLEHVRLLAHELFHPRWGRLRVESGCPCPPVQTHRPLDAAVWMVENALEELYCDLAADRVLHQLCAIDQGEGPRPVPFGLVGALAENSYLDALYDALFEVEAAWAEALGDAHQPPLARFAAVGRSTGRLLTLLAHAEAEAVSLGGPGAFGLPEIDNHTLAPLVKPTWDAVRNIRTVHPEPWGDWAAYTATVEATAGQALFELWTRLGLDPHRVQRETATFG